MILNINPKFLVIHYQLSVKEKRLPLKK